MSAASPTADSPLRRIAASDWLPAVFAALFYLQINNRLIERNLPALPADALMGAALAAAAALRLRYGRLAPRNARRLALGCLPWLLASLLSGVDARTPGVWRSILVSWEWGVVALLLTAMLDSRRALLRAIYSLVGAGTLIAVLNCHQFLTRSWHLKYLGFSVARWQNLYGDVDGPRAVGPVSDPNYHAQFLLPLLIFALERTWNAVGRERTTAAIAAAFLASALALTYSRGALVAIVVLMVPAIVAAVRWRVKALGLVLTLGIAMVAVAVAGAPLLARARAVVVTGVDEVLGESAFRGRLSENLSAVEMFRDHPWNGVGLGAFSAHYQEYASRWGMDDRPIRRAHNLYLEVAAETGIPGVLGFLVLVTSVFSVVVRTLRALHGDGDLDGAHRVAAVAMALAAFFATSLFLHLSFQSMFWVLLAIGFAAPQLRRSAI